MSEFKVGQRVRIIDASGSMFLRTDDIGTVVDVDSDGDVWARWENPLQKSHNNIWCSAIDRLEIVDERDTGVDLPESNPRLIAAAPDNYECNVELAAIVRELCAAYGHPLPQASLDRSDAAIAKATGE